MPDPEILATVVRVTLNYCQVMWIDERLGGYMIRQFNDERYNGSRLEEALIFCQGLLDEGIAYIFQDFIAPKMMKH